MSEKDSGVRHRAGPITGRSTSGQLMTAAPDYEFDGIGVFEAPIFDIEVDPTSSRHPVTIRLGYSGGWWQLTDGAAGARRLAEALTRAAEWAEAIVSEKDGGREL